MGPPTKNDPDLVPGCGRYVSDVENEPFTRHPDLRFAGSTEAPARPWAASTNPAQQWGPRAASAGGGCAFGSERWPLRHLLKRPCAGRYDASHVHRAARRQGPSNGRSARESCGLLGLQPSTTLGCARRSWALDAPSAERAEGRAKASPWLTALRVSTTDTASAPRRRLHPMSAARPPQCDSPQTCSG